MGGFLLLLLLLCFVLQAIQFSTAWKTRHFDFEVGYVFRSPDCAKESLLIGINGGFPGPTIRAKAGDTLVVKVKNSLPTEGVVIHWHGIRQLGTPWADGTASISQCAINPEETFTYRFTVDKAGTFFYHGHFGMQRAAGLYGSLIVDVADGDKEPFRYDGEFSLLLSDWYHEDVLSQTLGLSSNPFRWIGEPQSLLINGRGQYNCSIDGNKEYNACNISDGGCRPVTLEVRSNKTYRLRLASTTSLSSLNLAIGGHEMTVVEADGNYVEPFTVDDLDIYTGETYSVLITTSKTPPPSNFWLSIGVRGRKPQTVPALAVLNYKPYPADLLPESPPPETPAWDDYAHSKAFTYRIRAHAGSRRPPTAADRWISLLNTQNRMDGGFVKWAINNVSLVLPPTPYLGSMKHGLAGAFDGRKPPDEFPAAYDVMAPPKNPNTTTSSGVYVLEFNKTVDVVLQNANALAANVSEIHPWHLHGHDFWVLGYGDGKFDDDARRFNLKNPPLRNTVVIFPYGWTAIRFVADNPGVWPFHCHIEPHLHMGMGVVVAEGIEFVGNVPKEAMACGKTGTALMNSRRGNP